MAGIVWVRPYHNPYVLTNASVELHEHASVENNWENIPPTCKEHYTVQIITFIFFSAREREDEPNPAIWLVPGAGGIFRSWPRSTERAAGS